MKHEQLMDILVLAKRIGGLFMEVEDLSRQLAEAADRQDEVSMQMVISMRYEPIEKLALADQALREHLDSLGEEGARIRGILNGDASAAQDDMEKKLAEQAAANLRFHQRIMEQDRILSRKIAKDKSIYR